MGGSVLPLFFSIPLQSQLDIHSYFDTPAKEFSCGIPHVQEQAISPHPATYEVTTVLATSKEIKFLQDVSLLYILQCFSTNKWSTRGIETNDMRTNW